MTTEAQALDIRVVGLGQAGGNLAAEFHRRGYPALAFNTARTDLSALAPERGGIGLPPSQRVYIGIAGYDGAGADPDYGRSCVADHAEDILGRTRDHASGADVLLVTAGLGGGTGSAIRELIKVLSELDVPILCLATLPTESESGIAKVNAVRAVNELLESNLDGWVIVDNARLASLNRSIGARSYFTHINQQIAEPLDALNQLNERENIRAIRAFDGEDFRKVLLAGGIIHYDTLTLEAGSLETNKLVEMVESSLADGKLMPAGFDPAHISHLAIIVETPETTLAKTPMAVFDEVNDKLKALTEGAAVDIGIYQLNDSPTSTTIRTIGVCRGLPARIADVVSRARDEGRLLSDKLHESMPSLELGDIESLDLFGRSARRRGAGMRTGIGSQAARPAARAAAPSAPAQHTASRGSSTETVQDAEGLVTEAKDETVSTPPPLPSNGGEQARQTAAAAKTSQSSNGGSRKKKVDSVEKVASEELPSAEVYDDLVEQFRKHKDSTTRNSIAQQLEKDFHSPHAVTRFYAIDTMAKLDRKRFEPLLFAATEDENTAVRKIANAALQR